MNIAVASRDDGRRRREIRRRARYEPTFKVLDRMTDGLRELARGRVDPALQEEVDRFVGIVEDARAELRAAIRAGVLEEADLYTMVESSWASISEELQVLPELESNLARLSGREVEVLHGLATGLANKQIALDLGISERTVRNHVSSIYGKLEVSGRAEAAVRAVRLGVLEA